jgi:hypothetical protein
MLWLVWCSLHIRCSVLKQAARAGDSCIAAQQTQSSCCECAGLTRLLSKAFAAACGLPVLRQALPSVTQASHHCSSAHADTTAHASRSGLVSCCGDSHAVLGQLQLQLGAGNLNGMHNGYVGLNADIAVDAAGCIMSALPVRFAA